jgi:hypothetical protein
MWVGGDFDWPKEVLPPPDWYKNKSVEELALVVTQTAEPELGRLWRGLVRADATRVPEVLVLLIARGFREASFWSLTFESLDDASLPRAISIYATVLPQLGMDFLLANLQRLASIINRYFRAADRDVEEAAWQLWDLLVPLAANAPYPENRDPVTATLASPIGDLTEALLIRLVELRPKDYEEVPQPFQARLQSLLSGTAPGHKLARVVLAKAIAWLHQLNAELVEPEFLARFDRSSSDEACWLWAGYFMRPRITPELWPALRSAFLKMFPHSGDLGEAEDAFYSFFAWLLLHPEYELTGGQARQALTVAPAKGRAHVAWYWWRQTDSATDYGAKLYAQRLKYLLESVWPLEQELRNEETSTHLARLATCCSFNFPDAVATVAPLITVVRKPHDIIWSLKQKDVVDRFPKSTLDLLNTTVGDHIEVWDATDLREILRRIGISDELGDDPRFRRLDALVRRFE